MARFSLSTGTTTIGEKGIGGTMPNGEDRVASIIFQIWDTAGGFSAIPKIRMQGAGQTGQDMHYYNLLDGSEVNGGSAITGAGLFGVFAPECDVQLVVSAGTATCEARRVIGSVAYYHSQGGGN